MEKRDERDLLTALWFERDGLLRGFVVDPEDLSNRSVVEILVDGFPLALLRAHEWVGDIELGDGCYGFVLQLSEVVRLRARRIESRLANSSRILALLVNEGVGFKSETKAARRSFVRWTGGLAIKGWLASEDGASIPVVKALHQEGEVARAECRSWTQVEQGGSYRIERAFELRLPRWLADGRVHTVDVMTENGVTLEGSPCTVFALEDGFAGLIDGCAELESERVRARFADGLVPQSVSFADLEGWRTRFPIVPPVYTVGSHVAIVTIGEADHGATLDSLRAQIGITWSAVVLPCTTSPIHFDPDQLRAFLEEESGAIDLVIMTVSGTRFVPHALSIMAETGQRFPDAIAIYCDVTILEGEQTWPLGLPSFDEELFLEQGYCGLLFAIRPAGLRAALDLGGNSLYRLFPRATGLGMGSRRTPVHVPLLLAERPWIAPANLTSALLEATTRRLVDPGASAEKSAVVEGSFPGVRVRRRMPNTEVSVIVPVRNHGAALNETLASLRATCSGVRVHVIIVDNESTDDETLAILRDANQRGAEVLSISGWFNEPFLFNQAANRARCEHLLFLRAGVVAGGVGWLEELVSRCAGDRVGAVGPLIAWPSGLVREAGFVVGPRLSVIGRFRDRHVDDGGYAGLLRNAQEVSAIAATCMLTTRRGFDAVNGFDEPAFQTIFHDVDYCLRLRESGFRIIFTPHARLVHGYDDAIAPSDTLLRPLVERETTKLRNRWMLAPGCDPFYSPWMAMDSAPFSGLGWPPVPPSPRQPDLPRSRTIPAGF